MWGAGQLPKFADNLYHDAEDDLWLVPTAEVPLTNLHRDEILEPGVAAAALRGLHALLPPREDERRPRRARHQARPPVRQGGDVQVLPRRRTSDDELETLVADAEDVLPRPGAPYRVRQMCTGDLGFAAAKTYDIEMWAPGCGEWLEVSLLLQLRRLPGAAGQHPLPPRGGRQARSSSTPSTAPAWPCRAR